MEAILRGRTQILQTRLAVSAVQIVERLKIRSANLKKLLDEELNNDTRLGTLQEQSPGVRKDFMGLETLLTQKSFDLQTERRSQEVECWRDLVTVMRDFLDAWEALDGQNAKQRFLTATSYTGPSQYDPLSPHTPLSRNDSNPYYPN